MDNAFALAQQHTDWQQQLAPTSSGHKKTENMSVGKVGKEEAATAAAVVVQGTEARTVAGSGQ